MLRWKLLSFLIVPWLVQSLAPTDDIAYGDSGQTGYLPSHNMNPDVISSQEFGILWKNTYDSKEKWWAKPLLYTPSSSSTNGGRQLLFLASNENWIRTVDAVTGAEVSSRQIQPPFLASDLGCPDVPDFIGIIGTPVIDPKTETAYFFSKGYLNRASSGGVLNGRYSFHALNINDLKDRPGFPVVVDGHPADNDGARYFIGGTTMQRTGLSLVNDVVYGGFGSHCDLFNYTGWIVGVSTKPNVGVSSIFVTESAPFAPPVAPKISEGTAPGAGVWHAGMGLASDGSRLFFATGNGQGRQNKDAPASGKDPLSTLSACVINLGIDGGGKLKLSDYFQPYEYISLDLADLDLGSGGVSLLDPSAFSGSNGVSRIAVAGGKSGKIYVLNADSLGGFKQGSGGADNVLQTLPSTGTVYGGSASYPLEGGYLYVMPQYCSPMIAYRFGRDSAGNPLFSKAGQTQDTSACRLGTGVPTITTYQGRAGTAIVWVADVDAGLRAYRAIPDASGKLPKINLPPTPKLNKFQRPAFGDGRVYISDPNGGVMCLGAPVTQALSCSSPVSFDSVSAGSTAIRTVNCTTLVPIKSFAGLTTSDATWQAKNSSLPQGSLAQNEKFQFSVTWNLTASLIGDQSPGGKSGSLTIYTSGAKPVQIQLTGTQVSAKSLLGLNPQQVDFGGTVFSPGSTSAPLRASFNIANSGSQSLTITGYAYSTTADPPVEYNNVTQVANGVQVSPNFVSNNLPAVGSQVAAGQSTAVSVEFNADRVGNFDNIFTVWSDGGSQFILMTASATSPSTGELSISTPDGGWDVNVLELDFGRVQAGEKVTRQIRICNRGGGLLRITKSKPPVQPELHAVRPTSDFPEGQTIAAGQCATGDVEVAPSPSTDPDSPDRDISDSWTFNADDPNFGLRVVEIRATIFSS
ncbi:MAG: hypothetical protein M1816_005545 [Peltula sp. TS41687]|nr:MAG: hypothetical protein M1816_005545 [Peltula sp. TS41687]